MPEPRPGRSPTLFHIRVDGQLLDDVENYMAANNMTRSQAARILIGIGLEKEKENPDGFRALAFHEGLMLGLAFVKKQVLTQLADAFAGLGVK